MGFRLRSLLLVLTILEAALISDALAVAPARVTVPEFRRMATLAAANLPDALAAVKRARAASVVLLIPGALGSKMVRGGEVIWGEGRGSAERLVPRPADDARPEPLLSYGAGVASEDIYGRFLEKLAEVLAGKG